MSRKIHFELISPEEKLVSEDVRMAVIPGEEGVMGVMGGHCSLVASLGYGAVKLFSNDGDKPRKIFITGGFADITGERCSVLAEEAIPTSSMSENDLKQELENLSEDLGLAEEKEDVARIEDQIRLTKAKLIAVSED